MKASLGPKHCLGRWGELLRHTDGESFWIWTPSKLQQSLPATHRKPQNKHTSRADHLGFIEHRHILVPPPLVGHARDTPSLPALVKSHSLLFQSQIKIRIYKQKNKKAPPSLTPRYLPLLSLTSKYLTRSLSLYEYRYYFFIFFIFYQYIMYY